ncbi:MAG: hypothetical protein QOH37_1451 [Nocardioidaceae bacterium]|nr:hypothetical protein [Nocardioidaceae bacterium]
MNYPIDVSSTGYVDAVSELAGANRGVVDLMNALTDSIYGYGGMAGTDTGGEEWAGQYDQAASQLVQAGCTLGDALAGMANLLNGSLVNHQGAEHGALLYPGAMTDGDDNPDHGTMSLSAPAPPSARGGTGDQPGWWHWIAGHVEGLVWPDADTGRLRSAGTAWLAAADKLSGYQYSIDAAESAILSETSPEIDDVLAACAGMRGHITDLASAFTSVGNACNDYAKGVDEHHHEVEDELKSFVEWTIGIETAGAVVGFFTLGLGEGAAQAAEAAEVANAASKVVRILKDLIEFARTVVTTIKTALGSIARIVMRLEKFVNAKLVRAMTRVGEDLAKDIPAELKAMEGTGALTEKELEALKFYTGPGYDSLNAYLRGLATKVADGTATRSELEAYSRAVSEGLAKMPTFTGETLRGTNLPQSVLDSIDSTGTFKDPAFLSSSTDMSVAQQFRGGGNAMLHIEGTTGHDVTAASTYGSAESEVLFDKGTGFDVLEKVWNDKGYWDIYLKETP